jgi:ABC-type uncharacterized transport system permease subunit
MLHQLSLLPLLVRMFVKSQMEYRGAFWLDRLAQIVSYGTVMLTIWLIIQKFELLGGWNWPELALLFSFQLLAYSIGASLSFTQLRDLEELVRLGTLDALLTKPIYLWAYLVFSGLNIGYAGHIMLAVPVLAWALTFAGIDWSLGAALYLVASLLSATLVTGAILTMIGATALIWVRSNHHALSAQHLSHGHSGGDADRRAARLYQRRSGCGATRQARAAGRRHGRSTGPAGRSDSRDDRHSPLALCPQPLSGRRRLKNRRSWPEVRRRHDFPSRDEIQGCVKEPSR